MFYERSLEEFSVGDKVICSKKIQTRTGVYISEGLEGVVKVNDGYEIGVEWEEDIGGHDLDGRCKNRHGWFFFPVNTGSSIDYLQIVEYPDDGNLYYEDSESMMDFLKEL